MPKAIPIRSALIVLIGFALLSCKKDESEPFYIGKWLFSSSIPESEIDYSGSYIEIFPDSSFQIWDSSRQVMVDGGENRVSAMGLSAIDPETGIEYSFRMVGLMNNIMTLKGRVGQEEYTIELRRDEN